MFNGKVWCNGRPLFTLTMNKPLTPGEVMYINGEDYKIIKADPITEENQLQNIYVEYVPQ